MKREVALVASRVSQFGRHSDHGVVTCAIRIARELTRDHVDLAARVDLVVAASAMSARSDGRENGLAQAVATALGLRSAWGLDIKEFCASANAAIQVAATAIEAGRATVALVVGVDHLLSSDITRPLRPEAVGAEADYGYSPPVFYALCADRYLRETDASLQDLAAVAVRNRRNAATNPLASFRDPIDVSEVLESPMIAPPLTRLQCCPPADGAGGVLLAAVDGLDAETARKSVRLLGLGAATNTAPYGATLLSYAEDVEAAALAYEEAGVGPEDVDVAEVHDAFTISQVIHLEDLGLRRRGEGWRDLPMPALNPSGGLLSRGHPFGATGIAQIDGVCRALTCEHGERPARLGLVQESGGIQVLGQILSTCLIFERPARTR